MRLSFTLILGALLLAAIVAGAQTNAVLQPAFAAPTQAVQMQAGLLVPNPAQIAPESVYKRHWPAFTVVLMWLVRESHIWWPFLIQSGGIKGVARLIWKGNVKDEPTPPASPAAKPPQTT